MQAIKKYLSAARSTISAAEYRVDQWIIANPVAIFRRLRFRGDQKTTYNIFYNRAYTLGTSFLNTGKYFLLGYLGMNLLEMDHN